MTTPQAAQRTLKRPVRREGAGLHTGKSAAVTLHPAPEFHGVVFERVDLPGRPAVTVEPSAIRRSVRCTRLGSRDTEVMTPEHLLATLWMFGIDNARIEIDGAEVPGLDGSARQWAEALDEAGTTVQGAPRRCFQVKKPLSCSRADASLVALPFPDGLRVSYTLDYPGATRGAGSAFPSQFFDQVMTREVFVREVAPARTFCLESEVQALLEAGLGLGANTANTLVIGAQGVIDNTYRVPDEPVRHKVLDLLGDLAILGAEIRAHILATRSGHSANAELVAAIARAVAEEEEQGEISLPGQVEIEEILRMVPHRYPFLLIDRVIEIRGDKRAVGIKNVTVNEPFFQGHFPERKVMPGVLQVEAMAQLAGVLVARRLKENDRRMAYLMSIDKCRFRKMVIPGDTLRLEAVAERVKTRTAQVAARALVRGEVVAEAQIRFMIVG